MVCAGSTFAVLLHISELNIPRENQFAVCLDKDLVLHSWIPTNAKVSDGNQPAMTFDLSPRESVGSRSLDRFCC